ncbi:hypothetical protein C8J57DRAFT_607163 [Mycena rebaudengoi]|nr:hypothetical protein C8J57DRAFT_607163 [Mycena rebaudengoi]
MAQALLANTSPPIQRLAPASADREQALPDEWEMRQSQSRSGGSTSYYYNTRTFKSTWERPRVGVLYLTLLAPPSFSTSFFIFPSTNTAMAQCKYRFRPQSKRIRIIRILSRRLGKGPRARCRTTTVITGRAAPHPSKLLLPRPRSPRRGLLTIIMLTPTVPGTLMEG